MIQRQKTFPLIPLVAASGLLFVLATTGVELQMAGHGIQLQQWIPAGAAHSILAVPVSHPAAPAANPATRTIVGVLGRAPVAPAVAAPSAQEQRSAPVTGRCPTNPGIELSCAAP